MRRTLTILLMVAMATGCKTDVGPKKKVASAKIRSHKGQLWNQAYVLALRRVEKGRYSGRGGFGSWRRGYMRYHLVLKGVGKERSVFLYEARYRSEKGQGKGVDKLLLKASADDRCVAYSRDGGQHWRFVRFVNNGAPIHFWRPLSTTKAKGADPCASAPPLKTHFLVQLQGKERLSIGQLTSALGFLRAFAADETVHLAFARFMVDEQRRQYFHAQLGTQWRPVQRTACRLAKVRGAYLKMIKNRRELGTHRHTNAVRALEYCSQATVQDAVAAVLARKGIFVEVSDYRQVVARVFARITEARKTASPTAKAEAIKALPKYKPRVQIYLARALGTLGGKDAHAALRRLVHQAQASTPPGAPTPGKTVPAPEWPPFGELVKRADKTSTDKASASRLALQTAQAGLKR